MHIPLLLSAQTCHFAHLQWPLGRNIHEILCGSPTYKAGMKGSEEGLSPYMWSQKEMP